VPPKDQQHNGPGSHYPFSYQHVYQLINQEMATMALPTICWKSM
jgi:hypothetical protein